MSVRIEDIGNNMVEMEIEVENDLYEQGMQDSFKKNAHRFNVPGFRKGKAPRYLIERYYGEEVLYEDAINIICSEAYDKAVEETGIVPVDRPEIDIKQMGKGEKMIFTAKVVKKPEIELGEYKGIEVKKTEVDITDEDVLNEIKKETERNARIITVEDRPIQEGDIVNIDYEGFIDGTAFEGGKGENQELEIGSKKFIPGFEEQLVGLEMNREAELNVTFPEDYNDDKIKGKNAIFKVKIKDIRKKEIPVIDDEFVKDISEFDTLDEYKENIRKMLVEQAESNAKHEFEEKLMAKIAENTSVDIPEVMINRQIDNIIYNYELNLKSRYQGMNFDIRKYIESTGGNMDDFRKSFRESAVKDVKTELILEKIMEKESIDVTEEEIDNEIGKTAESYNQSPEEFKKRITEGIMENIKYTLKVNKTIDFLAENAKLN